MIYNGWNAAVWLGANELELLLFILGKIDLFGLVIEPKLLQRNADLLSVRSRCCEKLNHDYNGTVRKTRTIGTAFRNNVS